MTRRTTVPMADPRRGRPIRPVAQLEASESTCIGASVGQYVLRRDRVLTLISALLHIRAWECAYDAEYDWWTAKPAADSEDVVTIEPISGSANARVVASGAGAVTALERLRAFRLARDDWDDWPREWGGD